MRCVAFHAALQIYIGFALVIDKKAKSLDL
jgi:hypothetical protein